VCIYDPKVEADQIWMDLTAATKLDKTEVQKYVTLCDSAYEAALGAHALAIATEWDEFKTLDYDKIQEDMVKPSFVFDGRNVLDHGALRELGYIVYAIGKPLDPKLNTSINC